MYNVLNDDGNILNNKPIKTKKLAKQFIDYNYRCLTRDGFLEDYTFKEYQTSKLDKLDILIIHLDNLMNFLKSLTDSINYEKNNRPFFKKNRDVWKPINPAAPEIITFLFIDA